VIHRNLAGSRFQWSENGDILRAVTDAVFLFDVTSITGRGIFMKVSLLTLFAKL
jgi:hypothetical protein